MRFSLIKAKRGWRRAPAQSVQNLSLSFASQGFGLGRWWKEGAGDSPSQLRQEGPQRETVTPSFPYYLPSLLRFAPLETLANLSLLAPWMGLWWTRLPMKEKDSFSRGPFP
ncbi:hypothetical protein IE53DRAFT_224693 [Violaceomyces palustris]|uniref:Uncharacterized protein n=1 Tax=Violaceomyces palustris TaxID=1673888 RepID=A0ACD0P4Q0_9BASI|nr:hypothetical protein IE53DRAFT_224693 [Violaceomyces palustris]